MNIKAVLLQVPYIILFVLLCIHFILGKIIFDIVIIIIIIIIKVLSIIFISFFLIYLRKHIYILCNFMLIFVFII